MADRKRTLLELHFHNRGNLQFGPRSMGGESEEPEEIIESEEASSEAGHGRDVLPPVLIMLGVAVGAALLRRRRRAEREELLAQEEQKNLDRWIPTR